MENIIDRILEIDQKACKKLDDANSSKSRIIYDAEKETEVIKKDAFEKVSGRIVIIEDSEKSKADEKIKKIQADAKQSIEFINKKFEDNHEQWEQEILNKIIKSHKS